MIKKISIKRIGIFGGTFDPPHVAHLRIAEQAVRQLKLDVLYFVPADIPPHKRHRAIGSGAERLSMLRKTVEGHSSFRVSTIELKRRGVSYTVETLRAFHKRFSHSKFFLLVGGDNYRQFLSWKHPDEILQLATLAVYDRADYAHQIAKQQTPAVYLQGTMLDLSSTMIRERQANGESIKDLVTPAVERYIIKKALYRKSIYH